MYDNILIPTDGSPGIGSAVEQCMMQAKQNDATVHVLYIIDSRTHIMLPDATQKKVVELLREEGHRAVEHIHTIAKEHAIECVTALKQGVPHDTILTYAQDQEIDLIIMGTHGRSGEEKRVLGSVTEEVVRNASIPVMTVRLTKKGVQFLQLEDDESEDDDLPKEQQRYIG
ncbi:universal stress protein [Natronococcus wangiae]|uniref:universal stress protein n=1 Tax=Natronococcus wangiae TaxID=3068275 RepID=UPI00273E59D7|nr:universal stress protein [Natronococcus sp. AD5]